MAGLGDAVVFYDSAGTAWQARITDVQGGPTYSVTALVEGSWIAYGPSVGGQWTADPTPLAMSSGPGMYLITASQVDADTATELVSLNGLATLASAQAGGNLTPQLLIRVVPGTWDWDVDGGYWHQRFGTERITLYFSVAKSWTQIRFSVQDFANLTTGKMSISASMAKRGNPLVVKSYTGLNSVQSTGTGLYQEVILPLILATDESELRIDITSGSSLSGPTLADQYKIYQIYPEV